MEILRLKSHIPLVIMILAMLLITLNSFKYSEEISSKKINIEIDESSNLSITGSSNIANFYCCFEEDFQDIECEIVILEDQSKIVLKNTSLRLKTKSFGCGNIGITHDMWKCLKAKDYPNILIELLEIQPFSSDELFFLSGNQEIFALTKLTIAGKEKEFSLPIEVCEITSGKYQCKSSVDLALSHFEIEPPSHLMNLIKVNDKIMIDFNLVLNFEPL